MKFEKSDSSELERTMSMLIILILLLIPIFKMLEWCDWFPIYWTGSAEVIVVFGACMLLIFMIMYLSKKENRYFCELDIFAILYAASLIISTIFAQNVALALAGNNFTYEGTFVNLGYLVLLYCASLVRSEKYRKWIYCAMLFFGLFEVFFAVMQSVVKAPFFLGGMELGENGEASAFGTLVNQNTFGMLMIMFAGLEYGLLYVAHSKKKKIVHAILAVLFTYTVVLSGARGAMVGLAFSALVFSIVVLCFKKREGVDWKKTSVKLLVVIGCVAVACVLAYLSSRTTVAHTVDRTVQESDVEDISDLGSGRIGIWQGAWNTYVVEHPIVGVGVSNFMLRKFSGFNISYAFVAHNQYLDILSSRGIIGLVAYLLLTGYILVKALIKLKKEGIEQNKELLGLLIAYLAFLGGDFFEWHNIYLSPYFYLLCGLIAVRGESKRIMRKNHH